jgi:hypothetical protein
MGKTKSTTILVFISFAAILGFAGSAFAYESGIIKTVRGQVRIERGGSNLEARVGVPVYERDRVIVQDASSIGISMSDETLLSICRNSTLVIDKYSYDPVTREGQVATSILKGTLRYVTGLIGRARPQAIKITTNNATIGIRGTEFIVEVPDENKK